MNWLFDYSQFSPRSMCGLGWTQSLIINNQIANLFIALPYFIIATCLFIVWLKIRLSYVNSSILLFFVAFIGLCGTTHINDILAFYRPMYRYFTFVTDLTAIVSTITALILPIVMKRFFNQYYTINQRLENMQRQIKTLEAILRNK